jgi:hypothetical protein
MLTQHARAHSTARQFACIRMTVSFFRLFGKCYGTSDENFCICTIYFFHLTFDILRETWRVETLLIATVSDTLVAALSAPTVGTFQRSIRITAYRIPCRYLYPLFTLSIKHTRTSSCSNR